MQMKKFRYVKNELITYCELTGRRVSQLFKIQMRGYGSNTAMYVKSTELSMTTF